MNPIENEMPIKAIPLVRSEIEQISVIIAVERLIFPLLMPAIVRERKKSKKEFCENIHKM